MGMPITNLVFDRNKRASSSKPGAIELRITYNRIVKYATTGIRVLPKQWRNGNIVNRLDAFELQHSLDIFVTNARRIINEQMTAGTLDMDTIVAVIGGKEKKEASKNIKNDMFLVDYFRDRAIVRKYGRKDDTQERYDRFIRWFEAWGGMITFDDVTQINIIKMDEALKNKLIPSRKEMCAKSRWHNYHRFLNSFIADAVDDGLLKTNPYKRMNIDHGDDTGSICKHLTPEEFERFSTMDLPTEYLIHTRDLFVFQTYTCMAYCDMMEFDVSQIMEDKQGRPYYQDRRNKTGKQFTFMLLPPAMEIIRKYGGKLPMLSNQKYNQYLKMISVMMGLGKPLSSHWARHTGASLLLNNGVDMEIVSHILGHSSTRITRSTYAKMFDTTIIDAMEKTRF